MSKRGSDVVTMGLGGTRAIGWTRTARSIVALIAALACLLPATAAAAKSNGSYVALGDSFTAGPLIPLQIPPYGCLKSNNNYPHLARQRIGQPVFRDPSCSGAETEDMTQPQGVTPGPNPPQFDSLDRNTRVVTLQIGGNDMGFSEIGRECASATPTGTPCQDRYVVNGRDEISARIAATAPKVRAVLRGIRQRSPRSRTYVVNYLPLLPDSGPGCWPQMPVTNEDVPYLRAKQKELNAMLASEAARAGATLVDAYTAGIGHDACQLPVIRWVEPAAPASAAAPLHPNLLGMIAMADLLAASVRAQSR